MCRSRLVETKQLRIILFTGAGFDQDGGGEIEISPRFPRLVSGLITWRAPGERWEPTCLQRSRWSRHTHDSALKIGRQDVISSSRVLSPLLVSSVSFRVSVWFDFEHPGAHMRKLIGQPPESLSY